MANNIYSALTRRERQILDILYRRGQATAGEVMSDLADRTNYSTVRTQLRVLEEKGHARHSEHNLRYVYEPVIPRKQVRVSALAHVVDTFFEGSLQKVVAALLGRERSRVTPEELDRIAALVDKTRKGTRR